MKSTPEGTGYVRQDSRYAPTESLGVAASDGAALMPSADFGSGQTIGTPIEVGDKPTARLVLATSAKSGTNPTLDVIVQTSKDGSTSWRYLGAFDQQTDVGLAMSAVTSAGSTPPVLTLTGTALEYVDLRVECTTLGARGTWVLRYSTDGGKTWTSSVTSAATVAISNSAGVDTGLTLNIATGTAATDNVWTAKTAGYQEKTFSGCDRFIRASATVGGSATPVMTASCTGEAA
jgi:hypothetical protein